MKNNDEPNRNDGANLEDPGQARPARKKDGRIVHRKRLDAVELKAEREFFRRHGRGQMARHAWAQHLKDSHEAHASPTGRTLHKLRGRDALKVLVEWAVRDAEENLAILWRKEAAARIEEVKAICKHEVLLEWGKLPGEDEIVDFHRRVVVRVSKVDLIERDKVLVNFSRRLASGEDGCGPEQILAGEVPAEVAEQGEGREAYARDLAEHLIEEGEDGRQMVLQICDGGDVARSIEADQDAAAPLRFLAHLVLKTRVGGGRAKANRVGFGAPAGVEGRNGG